MSAARRGAGVVAMVLTVVTLTACSSDPEDNTAAACESFGEFSQALSQLGDLGPTSTLDDVREARERIADSHAELADRLGDVAQDRRDDLDSAWSALDREAADLDPDLTVPEALGSLREEITAATQAQADLSASLGC